MSKEWMTPDDACRNPCYTLISAGPERDKGDPMTNATPPNGAPTSATLTYATPWTAHYEKGVSATIDIPQIPLQQILVDSARRYPDNVALRLVLKYLKFGLVIQ